MITINYLKYHSEAIPSLAELWFESLGKQWNPHSTIESYQEKLNKHLNTTKLPITLVALDGTIPIGMCSLRETEGIRPTLRPWLGSLVVEPQYRGQGLGERLIQATLHTAKNLGYRRTYLLTPDKTLPSWYEKLGWTSIGKDEVDERTVIVMKMDLEKAEKQALL